jgi:site-specific DNA-methyltransferase (adenine-specific)
MLKWEIGDCIEYMESIESDTIDFMMTDPPYGVNYVSGYYKEHGSITNDSSVDPVFNKKWLSEASRIIKPTSAVMIFTRWDVWNDWCELISPHWNIKNMIVWAKNNWSAGDLTGNIGNQHELIIFATRNGFKIHGKRQTNLWEFNRVPSKRHPTEKPVGIIKRGIELCTDEGDLVLDPFLGSGTTLEACSHTKRNCIGFEIESKYEYLYKDRSGSQIMDLSNYV